MSDTVLGVLVGVLGTSILAGIGYIIRRWVTAARTHEKVSLYSHLAELTSKLQASGQTIDDIRRFEKTLVKTAGSASVAPALSAMVGVETTDNEPKYSASNEFWTTLAMVRRTRAKFDVVRAQIEELLIGFEGLWPPERVKALRGAYDDWEKAAWARADVSAKEFEGGTMESLLRVSEMLNLSEKYRSELSQSLYDVRKEHGILDEDG